MIKPVFISVVIATFGRPEQLKRCLESFTRIDYPSGDWSVLVVDDGSPMSLEPIVQQFAETLPIQLVRQDNQGAGSARNFGAKMSSGDVIAFTDDDCRPRHDWLQKIAAKHLQNPTACIGGATENALTSNPYSGASQLLIDYLYKYYFPRNSGRFFASNNVAFPKQLFDELGGFDTRFPRAGAEDRDICRRWINAGYETCFESEAVVFHEHLMTMRGFWRQHFNYGRGAFHFHTIKAIESNDSLRVEPVRFYTDLLLYPFKSKHHFNPLQQSLLLFVSQAANASGFFYEKFMAITGKKLQIDAAPPVVSTNTSVVSTNTPGAVDDCAVELESCCESSGLHQKTVTGVGV